MAEELKIPAAGESITEVEIGEWYKKEGDSVEADELLVVIETDKASMDLPSPVAGTLAEILKKQGETASVGEVIARIEAGGGKKKGKEPAAEEKTEGGAAGGDPKQPEKQPAAEADEANKREKAGKDEKVEGEEVAAVAETPDEDREGAAGPAEEAAREGGPGETPRVMPAARRALAEKGLRASDVAPSGPGGRLLKEDVEAHEKRQPSPAAPSAPPRPAAGEPVAPAVPRQEDVVRMTSLRRRIAERLVTAQQQAALLTTFNEVDMSAVMSLRNQHKEAFSLRHGVKLGFMSFFVKAVIEALKEIPALNAEIRDDTIVYRNFYDIGVAVGGGRGLVVPVVRDAERLSFAEIESTIADLAARARTNDLKIEELQGGTFTISNGGIYGSMLSTPIVNPPQSGILGMHNIVERPVALDGQVVIRPIMYVALTYDHRIVDGREAVTFLVRVKNCIEQPARMLLEV